MSKIIKEKQIITRGKFFHQTDLFKMLRDEINTASIELREKTTYTDNSEEVVFEVRIKRN